MTIDKRNPTKQRQQPLSLSQALFSLFTGDLGLPVHSMPKSRRDVKEQRAFLMSILKQAIEIGNDIDDCFWGDSSPDSSRDYTDGVEESSHILKK